MHLAFRVVVSVVFGPTVVVAIAIGIKIGVVFLYDVERHKWAL